MLIWLERATVPFASVSESPSVKPVRSDGLPVAFIACPERKVFGTRGPIEFMAPAKNDPVSGGYRPTTLNPARDLRDACKDAVKEGIEFSGG